MKIRSFDYILKPLETQWAATSAILRRLIQGGSGTEPEPGTGTVRTAFPETESGTGTAAAGTVFREPKPEPEPSFPLKQYWKQRKTRFAEEPSEPKTGTARTVPPPNRNRTEPRPPC